MIWTDLILARYITEGFALVEAPLQFLGLDHFSETPFHLTGQFSEARFLKVLDHSACQLLARREASTTWTLRILIASLQTGSLEVLA